MKNRTLNTIKKNAFKVHGKKKYYFIFYFLHFNEALVFFVAGILLIIHCSIIQCMLKNVINLID